MTHIDTVLEQFYKDQSVSRCSTLWIRNPFPSITGVSPGQKIHLLKQTWCDLGLSVPCFSPQTRSASPGLNPPSAVLLGLIVKFMYIHVYNTASFSADTVINTTNHMQAYSGRKRDSKKSSEKADFSMSLNCRWRLCQVLFYKCKQWFVVDSVHLIRFEIFRTEQQLWQLQNRG